MTNRRWLLAFLPLIAFLLLACNINGILPLLFLVGQQTTVSDVPPPPTLVAVVVTEVATQTTTVPVPDVELGQTIIYEDTFTNSTLTVSYPAEWVVDDDNALLFANSPEGLQLVRNNQSLPQTGQIGGSITILNEETLAILDLGDTPSPIDALEGMMGFLNSNSTLRLGDIEPQQFGEHQGAIVRGTGSLNGTVGRADFWFAMVHVDTGFVLVTFATALGELPEYEDILIAMMASTTLDS